MILRKAEEILIKYLNETGHDVDGEKYDVSCVKIIFWQELKMLYVI